MSNLLTETLEDIEKSGHTPEDIVFIGSLDSGHRCTWKEFVVLADVEYGHCEAIREVANDLRIVFSNGAHMWRQEYDQMGWWEYSPPLTIPENENKILYLTGVNARYSNPSLARCNENPKEQSQ